MGISDNALDRIDKVAALGRTKDPNVIPILIKTLREDPGEYVRSSAARYLGLFSGFDVEAVLLKAINDSSGWVRRTAAQSLFRVGSKQLKLVLQKLSSDADQEVRQEADWLMKKLDVQVLNAHCPFLGVHGTCNPEPDPNVSECSWEMYGHSDYENCAVYQVVSGKRSISDMFRL